MFNRDYPKKCQSLVPVYDKLLYPTQCYEFKFSIVPAQPNFHHSMQNSNAAYDFSMVGIIELCFLIKRTPHFGRVKEKDRNKARNYSRNVFFNYDKVL
jgi:hypothetical protein